MIRIAIIWNYELQTIELIKLSSHNDFGSILYSAIVNMTTLTVKTTDGTDPDERTDP